MAKVPWDDASKLFAKYLSKEIQKVGKSKAKKVKSSLKDAPKKMTKFNPTRGDYLVSTRSVRETVQGSRKPANMPSSSMPSKVKPTPKRNVKTQSPTKVKSVGEGVDAAKNMKTTKVVNTPVKPKRQYLKTRGRSTTQSPTEQRLAEKEATKIIRRTGDRPAYNPQPTSGQRPVGRPAPSSTTASKRTRGMSKDKGNNSRGQFEADKTKSEIASDRQNIGRGQPMPKKKNVPAKKAPAKKGAKPKRKPKQKPEPTSRYRTDTGSKIQSLKAAVNNAETPAQKRAANKARIEWFKKNGLKP